MANPEKLKADDNWELVTGGSFETQAGTRALEHLRGKPPLDNYVIHYDEIWGDIVVRHNPMDRGIFLRVDNPDEYTQSEAKQFVLAHDKRARESFEKGNKMIQVNTAHCAGLWAARTCDATVVNDNGLCPLAVAYKEGYQRFIAEQPKGVEDGVFPLSDGDDG